MNGLAPFCDVSNIHILHRYTSYKVGCTLTTYYSTIKHLFVYSAMAGTIGLGCGSRCLIENTISLESDESSE